jgi:hypothetical protein
MSGAGSWGRLTDQQRGAASRLFAARPPVVPGTRAVISDRMRADWYEEVTRAMERLDVSGPDAVAAFCDLAGVPD